MNDPTNCDRCKGTLDGAWSERWANEKRIEVICTDCARAERRKEYSEYGVLTSKILLDVASYEVRHMEFGQGPADPLLENVFREKVAIDARVKEFEKSVWFGGFQATVRAATHRGFRASFFVDQVPCCALNWTCAGRTLFTLQPEDESFAISLITAEDGADPVMGIQGIRATKAQAMRLLDGAIGSLQGGKGFVRDDKVGML